MSGHDIIVVGSSAGGVEALTQLVSRLPFDLPAAVFVVLHMPADATSFLPNILTRAGNLPAVRAVDGEPIRPGQVYVASPDRHLILERGRVRVVWGPKENRHRPAVDPLLRSAAIAYGPRVVGVVLSGIDSDGTAGLRAVKRRGGIAVVQEPAEAAFPGMPQSALANVDIDYRLPVEGVSRLLATLARGAVVVEARDVVADDLNVEHRQLMGEWDSADLDRIGKITELTCPDCDGPLWELDDAGTARYRCRVGHAFSSEGIIEARSEHLEQALWSSLNHLSETEHVALRLAADARARGYERAAASFEERSARAKRQSALLRQALLETHPDEPSGSSESASSSGSQSLNVPTKQ
ncbi:MAG TPA: chemotaxis protein CheB [Nitrolancea sp.]|nr:chemotaxis protein CheB [Nitrolancea sp.]